MINVTGVQTTVSATALTARRVSYQWTTSRAEPDRPAAAEPNRSARTVPLVAFSESPEDKCQLMAYVQYDQRSVDGMDPVLGNSPHRSERVDRRSRVLTQLKREIAANGNAVIAEIRQQPRSRCVARGSPTAAIRS